MIKTLQLSVIFVCHPCFYMKCNKLNHIDYKYFQVVFPSMLPVLFFLLWQNVFFWRNIRKLISCFGDFTM